MKMKVQVGKYIAYYNWDDGYEMGSLYICEEIDEERLRPICHMTLGKAMNEKEITIMLENYVKALERENNQ